MNRVRSERHDFDLCPIGLGTMGFGGYFSRDLSNNGDQVKLIEAAYELGVDVIDTAEVYGAGAAEETIGKREKAFEITCSLCPNFHQKTVVLLG